MDKEFIIMLVAFSVIFVIAMLIPSKYINYGTKSNMIMQKRKRETHKLIKNKRKR